MSLSFASQFANQVHFGLAVRCSIGMEHLVEPYRRLAQNVGTLPRIPRQICLRFSRYKAPIDRSDPLLLRDWQYGVERTSHRTRHILGADHWTVVFLQPRYLALKKFR